VFLAISVVPSDSSYPLLPRGRWAFGIICLAMLGLKVFGDIH
jgi:hypothetical protein